jgi:hypothetical protein
MNSRSTSAKALVGFSTTILALCVFGGELMFEMSEVTSREWKSKGGKPLRFLKLERAKRGRDDLAIAHYGPSPNETLCLDFYAFFPVGESTNAHLRLLEHDIREGRLVSMTFATNANELLISVTREWTNSTGQIIHNQYGYRLNPDKTLSRTTEDFEFLMSR